ncbi:serine/threonine-protein kinase Nek4 isoform X4 [Anolis carolinensis]|uniref:serine/threonine-protein kinase Nek4 isoform X4 n=1 Tax=Anolis carolinensis TaxID=28377 RepID=UPI002F2B79DD
MPLGEYAFLRAAGKGSYGEVSLVRHRRDHKQYVIKKLNLKHASRRERKAAEQEAQLLSQLKHPNIVTYRESWEGEDGFLYIVMGFCEGGDLYHKLKEQKGQLLPESQVVEWFVQIAMALQYLHEKHILHRDLKTQNVFLTRSNIIKVGDLGIARVLENQYDMASTLIGTPYYMSPELFSNKPYNYKSDVWALGCCAYELVTLKHAFNAKDMNSLVYRIIEGKLPPMPKDYSIQLKELIRTMLSKKPEERPSVRSILRQPYIKHQISLFLEVTKAKTSKNNKKTSQQNPQSSAVKGELPTGNKIAKKLPSDPSRKSKENEEKRVINNKTFEVFSSEKLAPESEKNGSKNGLDNTNVSMATMSKVDIIIIPVEKKNYKSEHSVEDKESSHSNSSAKPECETAKTDPLSKEERLQKDRKPCLTVEKVDNKEMVDVATNEDVKFPYPVSEAQNNPRRLQSPPRVNAKTREDHTDKQSAPVARPISRSKSIDGAVAKERPLSARERRRLKQSQEDKLPSGLPIRQESHSISIETKYSQEDCHDQMAQLPLESKVYKTVCLKHMKKKTLSKCSTEDELNSSTSSTERSDGDCKEGKTNEMNDLVQLMTQTLKMANKENGSQSIPESQFRVNRKYRDTLILHGKASEEPDDFPFQELPSDVLSGPEKIRRLVEILRADVVQGLGVTLLEKVFDVLEEDDEHKRELNLREIMGNKYPSYSMKARHLKFLEENVKL